MHNNKLSSLTSQQQQSSPSQQYNTSKIPVLPFLLQNNPIKQLKQGPTYSQQPQPLSPSQQQQQQQQTNTNKLTSSPNKIVNLKPITNNKNTIATTITLNSSFVPVTQKKSAAPKISSIGGMNSGLLIQGGSATTNSIRKNQPNLNPLRSLVPATAPQGQLNLCATSNPKAVTGGEINHRFKLLGKR
jgi:hypothetical protein